eukprot:1159557-Pelagomonas_calceolata.AAC.8
MSSRENHVSVSSLLHGSLKHTRACLSSRDVHLGSPCALTVRELRLLRGLHDELACMSCNLLVAEGKDQILGVNMNMPCVSNYPLGRSCKPLPAQRLPQLRS